MKTGSARDMFLDFLNFSFFIIIGVIVFYFFILGDRFGLAKELIRFMAPFSVFGLLFSFKWRVSRNEVKKDKREGTSSGEVIINLTPKEISYDHKVVIMIPILMVLLPLVFRQLVFLDVVQAVAIFCIIYFWHFYKIRKHWDSIQPPQFTRLDKVSDDTIIFFLPMVVIALSLLGYMDYIDIAQSIMPTLFLKIWRYFMLRR